MTVTFRRTFCAAHRIWNDDSACHRIHGHNYQVKVEIELGKDAGYELTDQGFVVPFDQVKQIIDALDHRLLIHEDDPILPALLAIDGSLGVLIVSDLPSTENVAAALARQVRALLGNDEGWVTVELAETDSITATALA